MIHCPSRILLSISPKYSIQCVLSNRVNRLLMCCPRWKKFGESDEKVEVEAMKAMKATSKGCQHAAKSSYGLMSDGQ